MANISMTFTYALVVAIWSFIGVLVAVAMTVHRNQEYSFMGPTPVSYSNLSLNLYQLMHLYVVSTGAGLTQKSNGRWQLNICGCG
jgi:hypothetical protein